MVLADTLEEDDRLGGDTTEERVPRRSAILMLMVINALFTIWNFVFNSPMDASFLWKSAVFSTKRVFKLRRWYSCFMA
ncbi:hypothetical protein EYF80_014090 [Liparis tanakae]|uniref:Uncharacterized protein n=1 Tax=Liparis tanakae TaxID=230148 RepID=A0A4Z2ICV4_9TELE|nr:hypothetical protein EYF80_014090 [Liparis tanakae]